MGYVKVQVGQGFRHGTESHDTADPGHSRTNDDCNQGSGQLYLHLAQINHKEHHQGQPAHKRHFQHTVHGLHD